MVLRQVEDTSRYGRIVLEDGQITAVREKGVSGRGLINGGIYLIDRTSLLASAPIVRLAFSGGQRLQRTRETSRLIRSHRYQHGQRVNAMKP